MERECSGRDGSRRPQDHNKPYSRRRSMMGRMKDTVKDMLSPSWLVDLVHSVKKKTPPSSPPVTHVNNNNTLADSCFMSPPQSSLAPPSALQRSTAFVPIQQGVEANQNCSLSNSCAVRSSAPFSSEAFSQYKSSAPPLVNGDIQCELGAYAVPISTSSAQTSLHSSSVMQVRHHLAGSVTPCKQIDPPAQTTTSAADTGVSSAGPSEHSYLWSAESLMRPSQPQHSAKSHKPAFNVSVFGSPTQRSMTESGSSLAPLGTSYQASPFYPGKTAFGGAAAHRRTRLQNSTPYRVMSKKQVTARPLNVSHTGGVTSSTAKRILDTLEKMSSPVNDAKRIPSYHSSMADSPLSFTPGTYRRRSMPSRNMAGRLDLDAPPTQGLSTPSLATVTRNLQEAPPSVSRSDHTSVGAPTSSSNASGLNAPTESARENVKDERVARSTGGKMKRDRGQHYSSRRVDDEAPVEMPNLPTTLTLPIKEMPKFDFSASHSKPQADAGSSPTFKFSSPASPVSPLTTSEFVTQNFEFSSPIAVKTDGGTLNGIAVPSVAPSVAASLTYSFNPAAAKLRRKPNATLLKGSTCELAASSGGKLPTGQLKTGSVMDFLTKSSPVKSTVKSEPSKMASTAAQPASLSELFPQAAGNWSCSTCLVQNNASTLVCVACKTAKSQLKSSQHTNKTDTRCGSSLSSLFQKPAGSWECPTCMIQNTAAADKCVSCQTCKPTKKPAPTSSTHKPLVEDSGGGSLANLFRKPRGSWECEVCMVSNTAASDKCVACSALKPGQKTEKSQPVKSEVQLAKPAASSATSLPSLAAQFSKPTGSWDCDTCMVTNQPDAQKCIACETPKTGATTTTSFKSPGGFRNATSGIKMAQGGGFTFTPVSAAGVANTSAAAAATTGFSFGTTSVTSDAQSDQIKPVQFGSFGTPSTSVSPVAPTTGFKPPQGEVKFGSFSTNATKPTAVVSGFGSIDPKASQSATFSFSPVTTTTTTAAATSVSEKTTVALNAVGTASTANTLGGFKFTTPATSDGSASVKPTFTFGVQNAPAVSKGGALGANSGSLAVPAATAAVVSAAATPVGGFQFAPATTAAANTAFGTSTPANGGFSFGAPAPTTSAPATFSFGSSTPGGLGTATSTVAATSGGFNFGVGSTAPAAFNFGKRTMAQTEDAAPTKRKATGFTTPAFPTPPSATPFAAAATPAIPAFGATTPAFEAPAPAIGAATPAFRAASTAAAPATSNASNMFQFGAAPQNTGVFQFGTQPVATSTAASGGFTFGQSTPQSSNFNFAGSTAPPTFNFTGNAPAAQQTPAPFQFGAAQPTAAANPFSQTHTAAAPRRPYKKAVRKLKK